MFSVFLILLMRRKPMPAQIAEQSRWCFEIHICVVVIVDTTPELVAWNTAAGPFSIYFEKFVNAISFFSTDFSKKLRFSDNGLYFSQVFSICRGNSSKPVFLKILKKFGKQIFSSPKRPKEIDNSSVCQKFQKIYLILFQLLVTGVFLSPSFSRIK